MSLRQVMNLRVGDTIMLNASPDSSIKMRCGGVAMVTGKMGRLGQNVAIRIDKVVHQVGGQRS